MWEGDPQERVYRVGGFWVMDASMLPGATGVNPILSVMGWRRCWGGGCVGGGWGVRGCGWRRN